MRNAPVVAMSLVVALVSAVPAAAQAGSPGPFGLQMGMSRDEFTKTIGDCTETARGQCRASQVPKSHPDFETYLLMWSPTLGLCKIVALGVDVTLDSFGGQLKTRFVETAATLDEEYGSHTTYDVLKEGSILSDPQDWTLGLLREERVLAAVWQLGAPIAGVGAVVLSAKALSLSKGFLTLSYESPTFSTCLSENSEAKGSAVPASKP